MSGGGGTVDTPDSNSGAARREGSNPSPRTAAESIADWNKSVFEAGRRKREEEWDARIELHRRKYDKPEPPLPTLW